MLRGTQKSNSNNNHHCSYCSTAAVTHVPLLAISYVTVPIPRIWLCPSQSILNITLTKHRFCIFRRNRGINLYINLYQFMKEEVVESGFQLSSAWLQNSCPELWYHSAFHVFLPNSFDSLRPPICQGQYPTQDPKLMSWDSLVWTGGQVAEHLLDSGSSSTTEQS